MLGLSLTHSLLIPSHKRDLFLFFSFLCFLPSLLSIHTSHVFLDTISPTLTLIVCPGICLFPTTCNQLVPLTAPLCQCTSCFCRHRVRASCCLSISSSAVSDSLMPLVSGKKMLNTPATRKLRAYTVNGGATVCARSGHWVGCEQWMDCHELQAGLETSVSQSTTTNTKDEQTNLNLTARPGLRTKVGRGWQHFDSDSYRHPRPLFAWKSGTILV